MKLKVSLTATILGFLLAVSFIVAQCESADISSDVVCPQNPGPHDTVVFFPHAKYCSKYYMCNHSTPEEKTCKKGSVWSQRYKTCANAGSYYDTCTPLNAIRECGYGTVDLIPHPTACHLYYNCSSKEPQFSSLDDYGMECPYPQVFDLSRKKCVHYQETTCRYPRKMSTWECDYVGMHQCSSDHYCIPCHVNHPSCVGKPDGLWPNEVKMWSPYYVDCYQQRSRKGEERCKIWDGVTELGEGFHPVKRQCVTNWEIPKEHGGGEPSCEGKTPGLHTARYPRVLYTCPEMKLYYCNPPLMVDNDFDRCVPFGKKNEQ